MNEALDAKSKQADENQARIAMWQDMFRNEGWRELVKFLESVYTETGMETPDSVKGLAARNAKMVLIKNIFRYIRHDFDQREVLLRDIAILNDYDDQLPDKDLGGW